MVVVDRYDNISDLDSGFHCGRGGSLRWRRTCPQNCDRRLNKQSHWEPPQATLPQNTFIYNKHPASSPHSYPNLEFRGETCVAAATKNCAGKKARPLPCLPAIRSLSSRPSTTPSWSDHSWDWRSPVHLLTSFNTRCYAPFVTADIRRLAMLKQLLTKLVELLIQARDLRYMAVPIWRPWRDF